MRIPASQARPLAAGLLALLVLVMVASVALVHRSRTSNGLAQAGRAAQLVGVALDDKLDLAVEVGRALASDRRLVALARAGRWGEALEAPAAFRSFPFLRRVILFDDRGRVRAARASAALAGRPLELEWFRSVARADKASISRFLHPGASDRRIAAAVPIVDGARRLGALVLDIGFDPLMGFETRGQDSPAGRIAFLDSDEEPRRLAVGPTLPIDIPVPVGEVVSGGAVERLDAGSGERVVTGYALLPRWGWAVSVERPSRLVFAARDATDRQLAAGYLLTLAVAWSLGAFGLRELRRREELDRALEHMVVTLEDRVRQRSDELAVAERQFQRAQRLESVGRLAGGIAHDFNNVLTAILGCAQCLKLDLAQGRPNLADLDTIIEAAQRAAGLTKQLLSFSRKQPVSPADLDLNAAARELERILARVIGKDIRLEFVCAPEPVVVHADAGQVEQALLNLAINARDAMPDGGKLRVEVGVRTEDAPRAARTGTLEPGRYAVLAVSDTGVGMTADVQSRLFEPFFTTKEPGKGTGLGLASVYGIIRQAGGHIDVESEPGRGTCFRLFLPLAGSGVAV